MKKLLLLAAAVVVLGLLALWWAVRAIPWDRVLQLPDSVEQSLGDAYWESYAATAVLVEDPAVTVPVDALVDRIVEANGLTPPTVHVVESAEVNAFALPGNRLVLHTALLKESASADEVAGVVAHELGHLAEGHVAQKLVKELGLAAVVSLFLDGGAGGGMVVEAARTAVATAFDREMEREADDRAVDYLLGAGIGVEGLAGFFDRLAAGEPVTWDGMSTHPDSAERAAAVRARGESAPGPFTPALAEPQWAGLRAALPG